MGHTPGRRARDGAGENRHKNGDCYWVCANVTPVLEHSQIAGYVSECTVPHRDEVASAEALYARMREQAAQGPLTLTLQRGRVQAAGVAAALARALRPGLGGQLNLTALAGTTALALLCLRGVRPLPALARSAGVGAGTAALLRRQALAPLRQAIGATRRMWAGDLSQKLASDRYDKVGQLAQALTQLNVNLQAIVGDVRPEVQGITLASSEIAKGNRYLGNLRPPIWPPRRPRWRSAAATRRCA